MFLDDGTGRIRPEPAPLVERLLAMNNPLTWLTWLTWLHPRKGRPGPADLLRALGRGQIELAHEAFHPRQPWRAAVHLRELLMACGVMPPIDRQLCSFERWLIGRIAGIDTWHTEHSEHARSTLQAFLQWCAATGLTRRFRLPACVTHQTTPLSDPERANLLGRALTGQGLPLRTRAATTITSDGRTTRGRGPRHRRRLRPLRPPRGQGLADSVTWRRSSGSASTMPEKC
jgi:hypothetical protein